MTIHDTTHLNVEVDEAGEVVAVWFRCLRLPFEVHIVDAHRASGMRFAPCDVVLNAVDIESETSDAEEDA